MITLPENDQVTAHWLSVYHSAVYLSKSLPQENGIAYAMKHFLEEVEIIHRSDVVLKIREARPYLAAIVVKALRELQGEGYYFQGIRYGYYLLHLGLRYHHEESLSAIWRVLTQAHTHSAQVNFILYRDVLGYIKDDIAKSRYATTDALRNDLLIYFDKIHRSSIQTTKKQQTLLACCHALHTFH